MRGREEALLFPLLQREIRDTRIIWSPRFGDLLTLLDAADLYNITYHGLVIDYTSWPGPCEAFTFIITHSFVVIRILLLICAAACSGTCKIQLPSPFQSRLTS